MKEYFSVIFHSYVFVCLFFFRSRINSIKVLMRIFIMEMAGKQAVAVAEILMNHSAMVIVMMQQCFFKRRKNQYCKGVVELRHGRNKREIFMKSNKDRSSHLRCSVQKGDFKNFTNFTGKHLNTCVFLVNLRNFRNTYF